MRLFAKIDNSVDRYDRPFYFITPFTIDWDEPAVATTISFDMGSFYICVNNINTDYVTQSKSYTFYI